jgi:UDP-N-acetylglucosamine 1-carboxyvinyltransferase
MKIKEEMFVVEGLNGDRKLKGTIKVNGSKNGALPIMASALLFSGPIKLSNIPNIEDVKRMSEIMRGLGAKIAKSKNGEIVLDGSSAKKHTLTRDLSKRLRASIILLGPVLGKLGKVSFPHPGGCVIGARPIDLFISNFKKMGCELEEKEGVYTISTKKEGLIGTEITFKIQSVTATETFLMAGILAKGKTILSNVALEPEVVELATFLKNAGAKIEGIGTTKIEIEGGQILNAPNYQTSIIPDRIEAGSFLILGALCGKNLTIENCEPKHLDVPIKILEESGVDIKVENNSITINGLKKGFEKIQATSIKTHEYPGFPTDLQAPMTVLLTQAEGESAVFETIFEGRLNYTDELNRMGAEIKMYDAQHVTIKGPTPLKGKDLQSPDIRAGLAFLIAANVANGKSTIGNAYLIDRGYEKIELRLREIGVDIKRISV